MESSGSAAWLTAPIQLTGSRDFTCDGTGYTPEQCAFYQERWHFWYIADYVYALPTIAFFMTALGIFTIGHFISSQVLGYRKFRGPPLWQKLIATIRYLSYRGFYVKALGWNSAPLGILLLGAIGTVYFFCMDLIPQPYYWSTLDFGGSPPLGTRSGWLALACMPFVFATATKTNWITLLTGVSHEKLQVFHRWSAYAFFVLALMHTFPFIVYHIRFHDMMMQVEMGLIFYWTGIVALVFQAWLTFASHSVIRNLGYEFFKATHLFAVVIFIIVFFWHCDYTLTSWHYFIATAAVYVPCLVYPWIRTCFEYGFTQKAYIHVEDNGFTRITIPSSNMRWKPGQHCFLRFTSFGFQAFSSHPFTICSLPSRQPNEKSELVFYIRHQRGLTEKLYRHALKQPGASVPVHVDGPYGGINMQRYIQGDRLLVVAGGSGAGWILPFIELFHRWDSTASDEEQGKETETDSETQPDTGHCERSPSRPLSLRVIVATRDISTRTWFLRTVDELLSKHSTSRSSLDIDVQVYLTGEAERVVHMPKAVDDSTILSESASSSENSNDKDVIVKTEVQQVAASGNEHCGRPELPLIVHEEGMRAAEAGQSLSVFVCGPNTMQNDVRNAVAEENLNILKGSKSGGVYLHSEHFSWA
ncbi:hypothetical protein V494_01026 [Pseudogymnoascus sp. VKM F-4513 (FW-928)]|nr:hypothetical protein V494_01026 [Pseudogymnoascus sp. VKM F-4513 (FW-928)]